ncbi:MAG: 4-hydroxythreonine-4-phosphate dehydrogenase PdxA, partial [Cytophagales bacterium]|nr:4-hydroxythreonine-4-phosphate dehydrogenase PdxA [Cytophagales bacterium]
KYKKLLEMEEIHFNLIRNIWQVHDRKINLLTCWEEEFPIEPGKVTTEAGKAAFLSLKQAVTDWKEGKIHALVTAPINKSNIQQEGFTFPGHTEYLTQEAGSKDGLMLLVSDSLRIGVITGHVPLGEVPAKVTREALISKTSILEKTLQKDFGISRPRIALLGLNPHAGEDGLLGSEDKEIIQPVVEEFRKKGSLVYGPYPADGFFGSGQFKKFDGILAMYHDQGLVPFKTLAMETGVNYTAGLPFIRTSPDHGTAYNIAGKNQASEVSFREALFLAVDIVKHRKN